MSETWYEEAYFNRRFAFRFGDCDSEKRAGVYAVMKLFSELAGEDYEARGLGYDRLAEKGWAFLISRVRLQFYRRPVHAEEVIARTWEREFKGPFFYRDYELLSSSGELLAAASSQWFLVDIASRDILRPALLQEERLADRRKSDCPDPLRLRKEEFPVLGERPVYFSDLDANGHVNNAVYSRIAMDFLPESHRFRELRDYNISFFAETGPGEALKICGRAEKDRYLLQGSAGGTARFGCVFDFA